VNRRFWYDFIRIARTHIRDTIPFMGDNDELDILTIDEAIKFYNSGGLPSKAHLLMKLKLFIDKFGDIEK
jgi:hypothetical protein